nr:unnamed protein product [Spirometra erinaceieuropaei]
MGACRRCRFEDPSHRLTNGVPGEPPLDDADEKFRQLAGERRTGRSLFTTVPTRCSIRSTVQRSPQYPVHVAQRALGVTALTWFSPPIEAVDRGVAAEQSPTT